jgi:hypothetical protein|tara:strand:+ start:69 stop:269 length:201 start_codon:yes stop_codon:yes gene_type:complete
LNTANIAGSITATAGISSKVLTRKAEIVEDMADISLTNNANNFVLRYNKSDDTYIATERNLEGGTF